MNPPFYTYPIVGQGLKKKPKRKRLTVRQEQPFQQYSNFRNNTLKPKFYTNIPMSNHALITWWKYLKIPINNVLSRDESVQHNHKQALFIYNLEAAYMSGSHWVATYVENGIINYFESFGMQPFQEIVNHARKKKQHYYIKTIRYKIL